MVVLNIELIKNVSNAWEFIVEFEKQKEYEEITGNKFDKDLHSDSEKLIDNNDFSSDEELITAILDKEKKEYVVIFDESNVGSFDIYEVKR